MPLIILTIIIYKQCLIRIKPLKWFLIPTWEPDSSIGIRAKWVTIKKPYNDGTIPNYGNANYKIAYRTGMIVSWLCFTLQFTRWKYVEELQSIYGVDYDCNTDPEWREKYERLCETGYFN